MEVAVSLISWFAKKDSEFFSLCICFFRKFAVRFYVYEHFWYNYSQDLGTMTCDDDYDRINYIKAVIVIVNSHGQKKA